MAAESKSSTYAVGLILAGFIFYIAADLGLLAKLKQGLSQQTKQVKQEESLKVLKELDKLDSQLGSSKVAVKERQQALVEVANQLRDLDRTLESETKQIQQLKVQVESVRQQKQEYARQLASVSSAQTLGSTPVKALKPSPKRYTSLSQWSEDARQRGASIAPDEIAGQKVLRLFSGETFFQDGNLMRPMGIRIFHSAGRAIRDLGVKSVLLQYSDESAESLDRLWLVREVIKQSAKTEVDFRTELVERGRIQGLDGFDVVLPLGDI